jgi:hypothetical protein
MSDAHVTSPQRWIRRPIFLPNQLLTADQLTSLVDGQRAHSEMLMRALHGNGVIFGFAVTPGARAAAEPHQDEKDPKGGGERVRSKHGDDGTWVGATKLEISCGMALDRHGRLLHWPTGTLCYDDIVGRKDCAGIYTLRVHYAERRVAKGGCGPCADHADWVEEGVVFSLAEECQHAGRCCPELSSCTSWDDYICARTASGGNKVPVPDDLKTACDGADELCRIDCSDLFYDADAGIPIACVSIDNLADDDCPERWGFGALGEGCEVRPYVYRTPLLHGCQNDLARVKSLSWQDWTENSAAVPWGEFETLVTKHGGLWIEFSKPIACATVNQNSVFLTATYLDEDSDYVLTRRIPARVEPRDADGDYATAFELRFHPNWVQNAVLQRGSTLRRGGRVELTIRCQLLRDTCRNMPNAVPISYDPITPTMVRAGDDFVAVFRLAAAPPPPRPPRPPKSPADKTPSANDYA